MTFQICLYSSSVSAFCIKCWSTRSATLHGLRGLYLIFLCLPYSPSSIVCFIICLLLLFCYLAIALIPNPESIWKKCILKSQSESVSSQTSFLLKIFSYNAHKRKSKIQLFPHTIPCLLPSRMLPHKWLKELFPWRMPSLFLKTCFCLQAHFTKPAIFTCKSD